MADTQERPPLTDEERREKTRIRHARWRSKNKAKLKEWNSQYQKNNPEKLAAKAEAWRLLNPEKIKAISKRHYEKNQETLRAKAKTYRENNPQKVAAYNEEYYRRNTDKFKFLNAKWEKEHPERRLELNARRRKRWLAAEGSHTPADIALTLEKQGYQCVYCKTDLRNGRHVDHIVPLSKGGSNWPDNLQMLCGFCNSSKGAKTHEEFIRWKSLIKLPR